MKRWLLDHKIGALEVLLGLTLWAAFTGTRLSILAFATLSVLAWCAKRKFNGEFSIRDVVTMVKHSTTE